MSAIKQKLKSQRGASITFALLLFVVCAVVSSVAIVAATTSAGRMSQLSQMDQRYYAVNSAAELLCNVFVGTETEPTPAVTVTYNKTSGEPAKDSEYTAHPDRTLDVSLVVKSSEALAKAIQTGTEVELAPAASPFSLSSATGEGALNCSITEKLEPNGLLVFQIGNADTEKGAYKLELTLASDVKKGSTGASSTTEKLTVMGWKLHSIKKIRADEVPAAGSGG